MTIALIQSYYEKQVSKIDKNFYNAILRHDGDAVHDLRVAIKRLRALRRLLKENRILRPGARQFIKSLRKIYRPLGRLRDLQVSEGLCEEYGLTTECWFEPMKLEFESARNRCYRRLFQAFRHFSYVDFFRFKYSRPYRNTGPGAVIDETSYMTRRLKSILAHYKEKDQMHHFHEIRKKLKELYYLTEIKQENRLFYRSVVRDLEALKQMEDNIGGWRDRLLFQRELNSVLKAPGTVLHYNAYSSLDRLQSDIQAMHDSATDSLNLFCREIDAVV